MKINRLNTPAAARQQRGAASVEFYVVSFFVLIPMLMAVMQLGLFFVAKNTVNLATFAAARAGAASGGDRSVMRSAFANAVSPLYVAKGLSLLRSASFVDLSAGNYPVVAGGARAYSSARMLLPFNRITTLNPTRDSFADFSIPDPDSRGRIIPTTNIMTDNRIGTRSKQTRADALLLKIEVRHCYDMVLPVIDKVVGNFMLFLPGPANDKLCYAAHPSHGIPIVSQAVVRMTVPPQQNNF